MAATTTTFFVRLRGMPFNTTEEEIRQFLGGLPVKEIEFMRNSTGRPSGECYVELASRHDQQTALLKDHQYMGSRYVEVFDVEEEELGRIVQRREIREKTAGKGYIRLKGLPFDVTQEAVIKFLEGLGVEEVQLGKEQGTTGRLTGEGYAQLTSQEEADRAMERNGQFIGSRYIDVYKSDGSTYTKFRDQCVGTAPPVRSLFANTAMKPLPPIGGPPVPYGGGDSDEEEVAMVAPSGKRRRVDPSMGGGAGGYPPRGYGPPGGYYPPPPWAAAGRGDYPPPTSRDPYGAYYPGYDPYGPMRHPQQHPYPGYAPYPHPPHPPRAGGGASPSGGNAVPIGGGGGAAPGHDAYGYPGMPGMNGGGGGAAAAMSAPEKVSEKKLLVRGLPFKVTGKELEDFFAPYECQEIKVGIGFDGRVTGDGIVEFASAAIANQALAAKDRGCIGQRYVELYTTVGQSNGLPPNSRYYQRIGGVAPPKQGASGNGSAAAAAQAPETPGFVGSVKAGGGAAAAAPSGAATAATDPWAAYAQAYAAGQYANYYYGGGPGGGASAYGY